MFLLLALTPLHILPSHKIIKTPLLPCRYFLRLPHSLAGFLGCLRNYEFQWLSLRNQRTVFHLVSDASFVYVQAALNERWVLGLVGEREVLLETSLALGAHLDGRWNCHGWRSYLLFVELVGITLWLHLKAVAFRLYLKTGLIIAWALDFFVDTFNIQRWCSDIVCIWWWHAFRSLHDLLLFFFSDEIFFRFNASYVHRFHVVLELTSVFFGSSRVWLDRSVQT